MGVSVGASVACTIHNYLWSNCIPEELLYMAVEVCYYTT
jgi:hypothetical protein